MLEQFTVYNLKFDCEATAPIVFTRNTGSVLRGALYGALRRDFCLNQRLTSCRDCPTADLCPICQLVATVDRDSPRGVEVPRPFALEPVVSDNLCYRPGETFSFGLTLFGKSLSLFPYAILAIQHMGELGIGRRFPIGLQAPDSTLRTPDSRLQTQDSRLKTRSGLFRLIRASVVNPLTQLQKTIYSPESQMVTVPDVPVTHRDVLEHCARMEQPLAVKRQPGGRPDGADATDGNGGHLSIKISLLTPMRLVDRGALVHRLTFPVFIKRLYERLTLLEDRYGVGPATPSPDLPGEAGEVRVVEDHTRWLDLTSYSRRRNASTPMGGLVGEVAFEGPLGTFLPLLIWGQFTHLGKDVTKGNGWYRVD
ncbi:MAG: CRISPR system precrRNA processing endoribonuclease RAMP protein Cas6 [Chloroflexi bacterium]|nr:CRISPR system precrRNA processing endoribonuclease RAMP protein Cas6 [Chloroflexota bacterium]